MFADKYHALTRLSLQLRTLGNGQILLLQCTFGWFLFSYSKSNFRSPVEYREQRKGEGRRKRDKKEVEGKNCTHCLWFFIIPTCSFFNSIRYTRSGNA